MRFERKRTLCAIGAAAALGAFCAAAFGDEVADRAKDPNLWSAPGGDQALTRHSALKDINTGNVGKLQMIWSQSRQSVSMNPKSVRSCVSVRYTHR